LPVLGLYLSCRKYIYMKHFSTALNVVLLLAVGVLYYFHFSGGHSFKNRIADNGKPACFASRGASIAYVDMDSVYNDVTFIKQKQDALGAEQKRIEASLENRYRQLEADKDNFIKKGGATITQEQAQEFQQMYLQKQQQIEDDKQQQSSIFGEKSAKAMEDIQTKVKAFLSDYNQEKKYTYIFETGAGLNYILYKDSALNITQDIVTGLNALKPSDN
jgi:outer membrane protein